MKLVEKESFHLALLDIKMGPVNGVQLLKEIKGSPTDYEGHHDDRLSHQRERMQASANGASAYLTKPVDLQKLVDTINSLALIALFGFGGMFRDRFIEDASLFQRIDRMKNRAF